MGMIERKKSILLNEPHLETVSGSVASFQTDMKSKLKECKLYFRPVQSGSGDPSPTNIRPITGRTGIETKHDDNLFSIVYFANNYILPTTSTHVGRVALTLEPNTTYTVSSDFPQSNNDSAAFAWVGGVLADGPSTQRNGIGTRHTRTITTDSTGILTIGIYIDNHDTTYLDVINGSYYVKLEKGSNTTPYSLSVYSVSWQPEAGTLYGGYVNLASGELVIDHSILTIDGTANWKAVSTNKFYFEDIAKDVFDYQESIGELSNLYTYSGTAQSGSNKVTINKSFYFQHSPASATQDTWYNRVWVYDTNYTLSTFKDMLNLNALQVTYKMRYHQTYQLTPQQIKAFIGRNNIWSDAGDVEVKYWTH